jgi:septal ring factor EnvC (AmiA/AmiB activator)
LTSQLEEQKKFEEEIMSQLQNKQKYCEKLEKENASLIKEINVRMDELNHSKKLNKVP